MKKIVINKKYGGFGLSPEAQAYFLSLKGKESFFYKGIYLDKKSIYKKIDLKETDRFDFCTTTDQGEVVTTVKDLFIDYDINREDPDLIKTVEDLGSRANGRYSNLVIVEIPDVEYEIQEYDGYETVTNPTITYG